MVLHLIELWCCDSCHHFDTILIKSSHSFPLNLPLSNYDRQYYAKGLDLQAKKCMGCFPNSGPVWVRVWSLLSIRKKENKRILLTNGYACLSNTLVTLSRTIWATLKLQLSHISHIKAVTRKSEFDHTRQAEPLQAAFGLSSVLWSPLDAQNRLKIIEINRWLWLNKRHRGADYDVMW